MMRIIGGDFDMNSKTVFFAGILTVMTVLGTLFVVPAESAAKLVVSAAAVPHTELLEFVKPKLAKQGIELEIITIDEAAGGTFLNEQTDIGENDVNFFQHVPYLNSIIAEKGFDLAPAGNIHVEPIGFYSTKYRNKDDIPANAKIAIPFDATNEYRALKVLENNGFIKLKSDIVNFTATKQDIEEYIKVSVIEELDASLVIRLGDQFDGYISNTNRILEAGIDANTALFREDKDSPYANVLVTKSSRVNDPAVVALKNALQADDVRKFIEERYKGAVVPAF
jgi:D-methionine transport system substrate-binding protein